jgi:aromatic amino acid aminotransferase I
MFLWIKLDWRHHPQLAHLNRSPDEIDARILEIELQIANKSLEKGVLVTRGSLFSSNNKLNGQLHFRLTFAAASREDLKEGVRLFAEALRECFEL